MAKGKGEKEPVTTERGARSESATASLERCREINRGGRQSCAGGMERRGG